VRVGADNPAPVRTKSRAADLQRLAIHDVGIYGDFASD
jgi:hypothetical protein